METYRIIRRRIGRRNEIIAEGLTLKQAKAHCWPSVPEKNCSAKRTPKGFWNWYDYWEPEE